MKRAAVWAVALLMVFAAAGLALRAVKPAPTAAAGAKAASSTTELARCRAAGEAAGHDPRCREAWRSARARFLGA